MRTYALAIAVAVVFAFPALSSQNSRARVEGRSGRGHTAWPIGWTDNWTGSLSGIAESLP